MHASTNHEFLQRFAKEKECHDLRGILIIIEPLISYTVIMLHSCNVQALAIALETSISGGGDSSGH